MSFHQQEMHTPLVRQLQMMCTDSANRKNMYWQMHYRFQRLNNFVSIPLLVFSSVTGLTSVSQVSSDTVDPTTLWLTAATGTLSTFIAALQRYLRYGERAEQCKILAKRYGDLARRIDIKLDQYCSGALPDWTIKEIGLFAEEMVQEMAKLMNETQDIDLKFLDKEMQLSTPTPSDSGKKRTTEYSIHPPLTMPVIAETNEILSQINPPEKRPSLGV